MRNMFNEIFDIVGDCIATSNYACNDASGRSVVYVPTRNSYGTLNREIKFPGVKQVIFNTGVETESGKLVERGATIVYFNDGTKVVVRKAENENPSNELALIHAILKRVFGKVDPKTGLVTGSTGNMIQRLLKNAVYEEVKIVPDKKESGNGRIKPVSYEEWMANAIKNDQSKCMHKRDIVDPWPTCKAASNRDAKGRFVKKSNRS